MKNVKRALSLVLVLALALSMCVLGAGAVKYSDVESAYAYSAEVQFLSDLEIITGYPDGTFQPEGTITRAEAAAVIFRMLAGKQSAAENYQGGTVFSDVPADHWASGYVNFATEMGIINGYPDGTFLPDQKISYGEYVTMLARALGLDIGKDLSYPFGYIAEATVENVNYGVDLSASEPCSRGAVAKLTYNAILDATYRRIANNIYVTEKPTIAKDVLKLELAEGVVTSIGLYDWAGDNAVGEDKFRIIEKIEANADEFNFDYELDNSYLGKEVKVWYKPDAVTASGDKVYAVVEKKSASATLPHIVLKGAVEGKANELTYALNDVDYKAKLDDNCIFVENNEYLGSIDAVFGQNDTDVDATTFYPTAIRMWLPINYTFIDNDNDGKYEFVVRQVYGFAEVANITSSKITLDGMSSIDRKDDKGTAYDWNDGLDGVEAEDWVIYYCDGALTKGAGAGALMSQGPDFDNDLYEDTKVASFEKMELQTLAVEEAIDHDKFVFDGVTYRTWTYGTLVLDTNPDLNTDTKLGDEFDLHMTKKFGGIIAESEIVSKSTGKYLVITDVERDAAFGGKKFDIAAVNEKDDDDVYTVKVGEKKVDYYEDSEKVAANQTLDRDAVAELVNDALVEYTTNSNGEITSMDVYQPSEEDSVYADGKSFKKTSGILTTAGNNTYCINSDTLVYVIMPNGQVEYKVYKGNFPTITLPGEDQYGNTQYATLDIIGIKTKEVSGTQEVKAIALYTDEEIGRASGASAQDDVTGYLRSVKVAQSDDGYAFEYTIAYDGDVEAKFRSATVDTEDDLDDLVSDDLVIDRAAFNADKADVVVFNIQPDGTVTDMRYMTDADMMNDDLSFIGAVGDGNDYYGSFVATNYNSKNNMVTLVPLTDEGAGLAPQFIPGAKKAPRVTDAEALAVATANYEMMGTTTYKLASDAVVYVIDMDSTNEAKVEIGSIGSIGKANFKDGYMVEATLVGFAYDADDELITAVFVNGTNLEEKDTDEIAAATEEIYPDDGE